MTSRYQETWVLGFLSGTSVILEVFKKKQKKTDFDAAVAYIDKYCRDNPLSSIMEASQMLAVALGPSN